MAKQIGRYTIVSELGRGGMGVVYKAWEESLQRHVAIKMLADQYAEDESVVARFMREARAVADVHHANIVQVFCVDTHDGQPYFVMEYVEGESLGDCIERENRLHPRKAVSLLKEAASGLAAAHARGVVHRDIKPANLMLSRHGNVKVVDFGIARVEGPETKLTATGMAMGTPAYLSPEVCLAKSVDQRSDIFSLGVVLYEMLTGQTPFNADSPLALMSKVVEARIPDLVELNGEIDASLYAILKVMLAAEPHNRYADCHQLMADLDDYLAGQSPRHAGQVASNASGAQDDEGATVAMATPADGQLPKAPPAPRPASSRRSGGKGLLLAGVAGVLFLGGVSAASWWALSNTSLSLPGFSQRSDDAEQAPDDGMSEPVAVEAGVNRVSSEPANDHTDDSGAGSEPQTDIAVPASLTASQQRGNASGASGDTSERTASASEPSGEQPEQPSAGMAWSNTEQQMAQTSEPRQSSNGQPTTQAEDDVAASRMQPAPDEVPGERIAQAVSDADVSSSLDQPVQQRQSSRPETDSRSEPPRSQPAWDPADPRVAVVVVGDRLGAPAIQGRVEQSISDSGFRLFDADLVEAPQRGGMAGFARALRAGGADVLVFVELDPAANSQLSYYGRQSNLTVANVTVRVVQLHDNKVMGPLWQQPMRYTELNAEQKAYEMAGAISQVVLRQLGQLP